MRSLAIASMRFKIPLHAECPVEASMGLGWLHYSMCIITHRPVVIPTFSCRMCMVIGGPVDRSSGHWMGSRGCRRHLGLAAVRRVLCDPVVCRLVQLQLQL